MSFNIPDRDAELEATAIPAEARMEAWEIAIEQTHTLDGAKALRDRLYKRMETLRAREVGCGVERTALALLHNRMIEILAGLGPQASATRAAAYSPQHDGKM